jgi:tryptophan 7-halogenase
MTINSILIVGGGMAGWSVAALLAKQLPRIRIHLLDTEIADEPAAESAAPTLREFHRLLDIDERSLAQACDATFSLAHRFSDWSRSGSDYWIGLGESGRAIDGIEFQQYANLLRQCGDSTAYDAWSLTAQAARHYKFNPLSDHERAQGFQLPYALQLNARLYRDRLRDLAIALGVRTTRGEIAQLELDTHRGTIKNVRLWDGNCLHADFFFDCSGASAQVLSRLPEYTYQETPRHKLLGDRRLDWETPAQAPGYSHVKAQPLGWKKSVPLHSCTQEQFWYSSDLLADGQAVEKIQMLYPDASIHAVQLRPGMSPRPWLKNCVALGTAAGEMSNLVLSPLHRVHSGILRWLELFPAGDGAVFAAEYNRLTCLEHERLVDFHWLPFALSQRDDSPYWRACSAAPWSESLQERIALFRHCGKVARYEQDSFSPATWASFFLANHCWPTTCDARLQAVNIEQVHRYTSRYKLQVQQMIAAMPTQDDYLSAYYAQGETFGALP